jgi:hypothetical protein
MRIDWSGVVSILVLIVASYQLIHSMRETRREMLEWTTAWQSFQPDLEAAFLNYMKEADEQTRALDAAGRELRELTRRTTDLSDKLPWSLQELRHELDRPTPGISEELRQLARKNFDAMSALETKGRRTMNVILRGVADRQRLHEELGNRTAINGTACGRQLLLGLREYETCWIHAVLPIMRMVWLLATGEWASFDQLEDEDYAPLRLVQRAAALSNVCRRQLWTRTAWCRPAYRTLAGQLEHVFRDTQVCVPVHAHDGPWDDTLDRCVARPGVPEGVQRLPVGLCPRGVGPLSQ